MTHGGPRTGAGRPVGSLNKADAELKAAAQTYTTEALERLVHWMREGDARASLTAAQTILDRGHGKPAQMVGLGQDPNAEPAEFAHRLVELVRAG